MIAPDCDITPTLIPSPQGGGKPALWNGGIVPLTVTPPSPLWKGIEGAGALHAHQANARTSP